MTMSGNGFRRSAALLLILVPGLALAGCRGLVTTQTDQLDDKDCLDEVKLDRLADAIRQCNAVVAAHPLDPRPWSDRSLLHNLAGDQKAACEDIRRAATLLRTDHGAASADPQLRLDIRVRQESCREQAPRTMD
jgi:hypothetical protein